MKIPDPIYDQYYFSSPENQEAILRVVENLLAEQKKELMGTFVNIVEKEQSKNYPFYDAKDGWREGRQEIAEDILESLKHHD